MNRHVFVTPACQENWGKFRPAGPLPKDPLHPSAPPMQLPGLGGAFGRASGGTPDDALLGLEESDDTHAWSVIQDFIAPIENLRCTVIAWRAHPSAQVFAEEVASNMLLLLDPDVCCDTFQRPKTPPTRLDFLPYILFR